MLLLQLIESFSTSAYASTQVIATKKFSKNKPTLIVTESPDFIEDFGPMFGK